MVDFRAIIDNLVNIGFYSVILPFILIYVVVFAILEKSGIFLKDNNSDLAQTKNINATIAFVFALFTVASLNTVMYIQNLILNIVLFIVFILVTLILLGFVFGDSYKKLFEIKTVKWSIFGIIILIVLIIFFQVIGFWDYLYTFNFPNSGEIYTYITLVGIGGIIYWVSKSPDSNKNESKKE